MTCVEDTEHTRRDGYPLVRREGKLWNHHRWVYYQATGDLPEVVRHTCDNRLCVNLDHLLPGTHTDNARDRVLRGRNGTPRNAGMPDPQTDHASYQRERRRRIEEGTWVRR